MSKPSLRRMKSSSIPPLPAGYTLVGELRGGSLGVSITAKRSGSTDTFVIKIVDRECIEAQGPRFLEMLRRIQQTQSKFIVPFSDIIETETHVYLVRPFITCPNLHEELHFQTAPDLNYYFVIWKVLLRILQTLHSVQVSGLFIRPCNIFLNRQNEPVLTDIYPPLVDTCRKHGDPRTICFLAPEFFFGDPPPSEASDIWSVTVIFLYMMTRQIPWNTTNLFKMIQQITKGSAGIVIKVPDEIKEIIAKTLVVDPSKRPNIAWLTAQNPIVSTIQSPSDQKKARLQPQKSTLSKMPVFEGHLKTRQSLAQLPPADLIFNDH